MELRLRGDDAWARVKDLRESPHGCITALEQIHDPAQRDHRPRQHRQVHTEGDEGADGNGAANGEYTASAEHDDGTESAEEREQRIQRAPQAYELHVEREVLVVERAEAADLGVLLAIRSHDARSGEILLGVGG